MRMLKRILLSHLLVALLVTAGVAYLYWQVTRGPLPVHSGEWQVPGLRAPVEVLRDEWGIPHVYAENLHDLLFAQGYVQAQDRWWQMETYRRVAQGRLSELTGQNPDAQKTDVLMRTLGLYASAQRDAEALPETDRAVFEAFAAGINAYVDERGPWKLAIEYPLLALQGVRPEIVPWTLADSIAFGKLMGYVFSGRDLRDEPLREQLKHALAPELLPYWAPEYPYSHYPTTIGRADLPQITGAAAPAQGATPVPAAPTGGAEGPTATLPGADGQGASNAWAISGDYTTTRKPLFASDPHQGIELPALWYEIGLHCPAEEGRPALDLYGYAAPLLPFVQAGNNAHITWGLTNVTGSNALDLFRIRFHPDNPNQYEWDGAWREMTAREETITVAGGEPITLTVRETHLGPLAPADTYPPVAEGEGLAICWDGLRAGTAARAALPLAYATNFDEFRAALAYWDYPAANIPYADTRGNIGFQQTGRFPIRPAGTDGLTPTPGWSSEYEWTGFIPYELLPHVLNPQSGMVVAANQPAVPPAYYDWLAQQLGPERNYAIAPEPGFGSRARRIEMLLRATPKHDVASFAAAQTDTGVDEFRIVLQQLNNLPGLEPDLADTVQWLGEWDLRFDTDSSHALFAGLFWQRLVDNLYTDQLPAEVHAAPGQRQLWSTEQLFQKPDHPWWDDVRTPERESRRTLLTRTLRETLDEARATHGPDRTQWRWGAVHVAEFRNAFLGASGVVQIEALVNRPPQGAPGAAATVNIAMWKVEDGLFKTDHLPAYRRVVDLADFDNSVAVNSTGQSAHPYSPHYADQMAMWLKGDYRPVHFTRERVEAAAKSRMVLQPE